MRTDGNLNEANLSTDLMKALKLKMREVCLDITGSEKPFRDLTGSFPKMVRAGMGGVSVHLCASDTRRLAPDTSREITVWLTLVDLGVHNPVNAAMGGTLLKRRQPVDRRAPYVVKGELACVRSLDEIEAEEKRQLDETENELKRLRTGRLARARAARETGCTDGTVPSQPSPRDFASKACEAASTMAEAEAAREDFGV
jgi:hypothetical protein